MDAILLAAGYATRLYPLTADHPKALLSVGHYPMIHYILQSIQRIPELEKVWLVTNDIFLDQFKEWKNSNSLYRSVQLVNDGTRTPETRMGAIRDLDFCIEKHCLRKDLLVIGADNLFEFDLRNFVLQGESHRPYPTLGVYNIGSLELAKRFGVVTLNGNGRISHLLEKPTKPHSTLVAMCLYYFPKESMPWIRKYLDSGLPADAPGHLLSWLANQQAVYGYLFEGRWFDIGDLRAYQEARKVYNRKRAVKTKREKR